MSNQKIFSASTLALTGMVVPIRAGFDESAEIVGCLTFSRTRQIALDVADARERELHHIRNCNECGARLRAFQRELGTNPHDSLSRRLSKTTTSVNRGQKLSNSIIRMFALNLFTAYKFQSPDSDRESVDVWHHSHDLAYVLRHARVRQTIDVGSDIGAVFDACAVGLAHAGKTWAVEAESLDDCWLLHESLQEGVTAVADETALSARYARLYAHVAIESPPYIRHGLLGGVSTLFKRGAEARHVGVAVLDELLNSRHAPEVSTAATLIMHFHSGKSASSLTDAVLVRRIEETTAAIDSILSSKTPSHHHFEDLLYRTFEQRSPRSQIVGMLVLEWALHNALHAAHGHDIQRRVEEIVTSALAHRSDRTVWPLLAGTAIAATTRNLFPTAYIKGVTTWIHSDSTGLFSLSPFERHAVFVTALAGYEADLAGAAAPHFEHTDEHWKFHATVSHPMNALLHSLASIANEDRSYDMHLEWANARFQNWRYRTPGKQNHKRHASEHRNRRQRQRQGDK